MNEQQYTAVVAQNKSLQIELRLYKKALELMAEEVEEKIQAIHILMQKTKNVQQ